MVIEKPNKNKYNYFSMFEKELDKIIKENLNSKNGLINCIEDKNYSKKSEETDSDDEIPDDEKEFMEITEEINDINDIINIAKKYTKFSKTNKFSIDIKILKKLIEPLEKLNNIIGMSEIKVQLVDQILSSLQKLYDSDHRFHTVIKGPPGVGKTMLAKILGEIYLVMGILENKGNKLIFKVAKRSDLIGKYLGHTSKQTQNFINSCIGGVMFIDEVYSLGNSEKRDSFAKECIDAINLNLTETKNFVCIIAGYPEEIENVFAYNPGLRRRFSFSYSILKYTSTELADIFILKINLSEWKFSEDIVKSKWLYTFMEKNINDFPYYGGDIDVFILKCRTAHGRRIFGKSIDLRKNLNKEDINRGFDMFKESKYLKRRQNIFKYVFIN